MKRLIKKAEVDLSRYTGKFRETDNDVITGQDRGGETKEYCVMYRLEKTDETPQQWIEVCDTLMGLSSSEALALVGRTVVADMLEALGAEDTSNIKQDYYDKSDQWFEFVFSVTEWYDEDNNEFRR